MTDRRTHPLLCLRRARFLHAVLSAPMFAALASTAAAPVAVAVIPGAVATFHLVIVLAAVPTIPTIVILSAQRQGADTEDHQQAKYYDFLYEHGSPFRHSSSCG